jgi:hypothetical protein
MITIRWSLIPVWMFLTGLVPCQGMAFHANRHRQSASSNFGCKSVKSSFLPERSQRPSRRNVISFFAIPPLACFFLFVPLHSADGAAPLDVGEAIRRSAANVPGYGQTDIFFPESFAGTWKVTRDVEFSGASKANLRLQYSIRFIKSIEHGAVVADRGYNQAELETAIARTLKRGEQISVTTANCSYEWVPTNPNELRLQLSDGTRKEIKVTKRATERSNDSVSSSEFQRVTQEDSRGVPVISARRVVSKWRTVDDSTVEAIEIVYDMGGGDPLAGDTKKNGGNMLSKSRLQLVR